MWHYTGSKQAFVSKTEDGKWQVLGVNGRVLYTAPNKERATSWAKEHGYALS